MPKIFIDTGDAQFYNYDCVLRAVPGGITRRVNKSPAYCLDHATMYELESRIRKIAEDRTVKEGASIHLLNSVPVAIDDLRAHYSIKRTADTADYNIFHYDRNKREKWFCTFRHIVICQEHKKVLCSYSSVMTFEDVKYYFPEVTKDECLDIFNRTLYWNYDYKCVFPKVLAGEYSRPTLPATCLKFSNPNELTFDTLQMTFMAAKNKDEQVFLTQLAILNQTNWAEYPGTMYYLRKFLRTEQTVYRICQHLPSYSKYVSNILRQPDYDCAGERDFNLMRRLFDYVLGFTSDTMFVDYPKLVCKMVSCNLNTQDLEKVYSMITRVKPKEYINEQTYSKAE